MYITYSVTAVFKPFFFSSLDQNVWDDYFIFFSTYNVGQSSSLSTVQLYNECLHMSTQHNEPHSEPKYHEWHVIIS